LTTLPRPPAVGAASGTGGTFRRTDAPGGGAGHRRHLPAPATGGSTFSYPATATGASSSDERLFLG